MLLIAGPVFLAGCTSSPRSQDFVRRTTAAVTRTVASNVKGAVLGIGDGLRHDPNNDAVDINTAPTDKLLTLPGIDREMAATIVRNRPYKKSSDLERRHIVPKAIYSKIAPRLVIR